MGWKSFKNYFNIEHIVCIKNGKLVIGSDFVSDLVSIDLLTGVIQTNNSFHIFLHKHYPQLLGVDSSEILNLLNKDDTFSDSIKVFTYKDDILLEKYCEKLGWPNITHDGEVMYENTFSTDKLEIIKKIKLNLRLELKYKAIRKAELTTELESIQKEESINLAAIEHLDIQYPEIKVAIE